MASKVAGASLVVAAVGVVIMIAAGVDFGTTPPPGLFILLIPAGLIAFGGWRWTPIVAALAGLFILVSYFLSGSAARLADLTQFGALIGFVAPVRGIVRCRRSRDRRHQPELPRPWMNRLTGILGLAWFALFAVGAIVLQGEPPAPGQPVGELRELFSEHHQRYLVGDYLIAVAFFAFFLPFAAGLRGVLAAADPQDEILPRLAFTGAVVLVVLGGTATAYLDAVAITGGRALDDSTLRALLGANAAAIASIGLPAALFSIAVATAVWRTAALARPLAFGGWAAGALLMVGAAFPIQGGAEGALFALRFASFIALALFVLATSVSLLRTEPSAPKTARRGPAGR